MAFVRIIKQLVIPINQLFTTYSFSEILLFGWYDSEPTDGTKGCNLWYEAKLLRESFGDVEVDAYFKSHLSIVVPNPEIAYPNVNTVWKAFGKRFGTLISLINYKDLVKDYFYQGLLEFYNDKVQYMEVRSVLAPICQTLNAECNPLDIVETAKVFKEAADQFAKDHPGTYLEQTYIKL